MIVVTGTNGHLGRGVVDALLSRMAASRIVATARDQARASALAEQGLEVRRADFAAPDELASAFAGASQVLLVSVDRLGQEALRLHRNAIEAAQASGARRVLYTSHMAARADSPFAPAPDHFATEANLAQGGGSYTALRHGFYAESARYLLGDGLHTGVIRAPEDGPVSWTARGDLAEADAVLLVEEGRLDGITPPLTGPEAISLSDIAALASELTGREIRRVTLSDRAWLDETMSKGVPAAMAEMLLGMYRAARRGDFAAVDPTLEALLGRRPRTMREVLATALRPDT